jgi:pimeloyl-ACP methyl ester carboxylesterase
MSAPRHAQVNGIDIAYRIAGSQNAETVLLIPGVGAQLDDRTDPLTRALVERGYRVVTYDSRDSGASTHMDRAGRPDWGAIHAALVAGQAPPNVRTARCR